ncbi:hypothetical protein HCN44_010505 [Aphidius gifuensis]|uniref:Uncharacterized protein n=1 Tax=Aphidius gifuensis TaxID=684658 RepID=A0A834XUZ3_APHGI|nr:probable serine/threonine-protein kinase mps1 [Aphidius gifuensis]KAF7991704.1 hypothetical protein HCN44_010505 [Aphidius gifuensis]
MFKVNVLILFVTALFCALTISQVEGTVKYVHPSRRNANANSNTNTNSNTNSNRNKNRRNANDGISNDTLLSPESSCVEEKTVAAAMAAAEATKTIATALLQDLSETTGDAVAVAVLRILSDKKRRPSRRSIKAAARGAVITAATRRNSNINSNTNINTNFNSIGKKQPQPQQLQQQQLRKPKRMGRPTATGYIYQRPNEALILGPISYGKLKGYVNKLDLGSLNAESDYFGMPMEGTGGFDHQGDIYYDSLEDEDDDEDEDEDADDNDKNDDSSNKEKDEAVDASPEDKHPTRVKNKNININTNFNSRRGVYTPGRLY